MTVSNADLVNAAIEARENAYARYSGFKVGAALIDDQGRMHVGCNVENASYPVGTCAEAGAIAAMVAATDGDVVIAEIVTVTEGDTPGTPCGGCRQRIREFSDASTQIHAMTVDGAQLTLSLEELLPHSFGPERLR